MNEAKHTHAPWCISDESPKIIKQDLSMIGSSRGVLIAFACGHHNSGFYASDEQAIANARLIAAAPELLEALKAMVDAERVYESGGHSSEELDALEKAHAAIAKATGRADSGQAAQGDRHE